MLLHAVFALAARQHGLVTYAQLLDLGVPDSTIRLWLQQGRLDRVAPAVYRVGGAPQSWRQRVMRAVLDSGGWASHRTAAALHLLDGHTGVVIEVTVERWRRSSRHDGYAVHEAKDLRPADLTEIDGIPCTSLVRTLLDLPAVEHRFRAEQAFDHALRRDADVAGAVRNRFVQVARRGRNGTTTMRAMLAERTGEYIPPGSTFERIALRWIARAGLATPVKQVKVVDGEFVAYIDLAWPDLLFGFECESFEHHSSKAAAEYGRRRRRRLKALGWEITEWSYDEVRSGAFIPELTRLLASRTAHMRGM